MYNSVMARRTQLSPHLSVEELGQRYKQAPTPAAARRYQAVWLIAQDHTAKAAAALVGLSDKWVRALVQRYNALGEAGLTDRRSQHPGQTPLLTPDQHQALAQALQAPPAEGGIWTGRKVAAWMTRTTGRPTHHQRGWDYLRRLGYSRQQPRPRHAQAASAEEQVEWQKNSSSGSPT
jgi:transposase